ncbi:hypothetical protein ZTR_10355 [Talaromyces verruculosus]|nr:hypothetical protein ZTR_10355 [Talaromyces verruculosus]
MRLRASMDREEIRQQYMSLTDYDEEAVESAIDVMSSYFITYKDWDGVVEPGRGPDEQELGLKKASMPGT